MEPRRLRLMTFTLIALLVIAGTAIAGTSIVPNPLDQDIEVGKIGTYIITVNTSTAIGATHTISFDTRNDSLVANLTGQGVYTGALSKTGSGDWIPTVAYELYNFTYAVKPKEGITIGKEYVMTISDSYDDDAGEVMVTASASTTPIPELTTFALVGIGLIGLVALGRRKE